MKYKVMVNRITYQSKTFEVNAEDKSLAMNVAIEEAHNTHFDKDDFAKYEVDFVEEVIDE